MKGYSRGVMSIFLSASIGLAVWPGSALAGNDSYAGITPSCRAQLVNLLHNKTPRLWTCDAQGSFITPGEKLGKGGIDAAIERMNLEFQQHGEPLAKLHRVRHNTAIIQVSDPELLRERMGSTGAGCYMATVTFTLTSLDGIDYVWFDLEEGSHATGGTYGRASFLYLLPLD